MPVVESKEEDISSNIIGLIIPPPELRNIVDKTASFVARNGTEFENKIHEKEENNKKFNFLKAEDPYHKYYLKKVQDFCEGKELKNRQAISQVQQEILKKIQPEQFKPDKPPKEYEYIIDPPSISPLELNTVKLTAQFVARNGKKFLTELMNREQKNSEFDFLRPQHILFPYFAKLLENYTRILIPPKDLLENLKSELEPNKTEDLLKDVKYRANWIKYEERQKMVEVEKAEKERMAYNSIDWHDFFVVEEVNYYPDEFGDFPPPITPETLGKRLITEIRETAEETFDVEMQIESGDESDTDNQDEINVPEPVKVIENIDFSNENIPVKKYDPKSIKKPFVASKTEEHMISPLTGELIPASKLAEHMRIGLLDPRWIEQRDKLLEKSQEECALTTGETVGENLKQLAERRTDIFGEGDKETEIGKKIGEEERKEDRMIWDGHSSSVESITRATNKIIVADHAPKEISSGPKQVMREKKQHFNSNLPRHPNLMNNYENIRCPAPLPVPPPLLMLPPINPAPFPIPFIPLPPMGMNLMHPQQSVPMPEDEQPAKKPCLEDKLIPEEEFLKLFITPININVQVPTAEKSEWNLNGQLLSFDVELRDTVISLKQKIQEKTEMPPTKQKISLNGIFIKDSNTLAYYNVLNGSTLNLQIKERGGRKK